jgi:hypothetical protein
MKIFRLVGSLFFVMVLAGVAYVSPGNESSGLRMADAAEHFLGQLTAEQRAKATFAFDDRERFHWDFVPLQDSKKRPERKGIRLEEMSSEQKDAARTLLKAGTSATGYIKATTIMSLEDILRELEKEGGNVRNPGWYFFTIFGTPSHTGRWGWRVEGHHLSLNFVIDGGQVVSATPAFFGANPALVKDGPRRGEQTLLEAEELAKLVYQALDSEQRALAHVDSQFAEVGRTTLNPEVGKPRGLPANRMTEKQQRLLQRLIESYAQRMPADVAESEMKEVRQAGLGAVHFAFAGGVKPGEKHSYRVQGPTFVIEFLNIQADSANNPANHIHSAWRSIHNDFGMVSR